jgi:adenosylhomocysteine nucleosidase
MATVIVTGLEVEARIARRAGLPVIVVAGKADRRASLIAETIAGGATGLISFGIAGGLDPNLAPGTVLLPETVHTDRGETFHADALWRRRLLAHIPGAISGAIYGGEGVVSRAAEKRTLFGSTKATAVDLESGPVARAATEAGIPFVVLRSIADPAHRNLPRAAVFGLNDEGKVAYGTMLGHVVRNLHQFPALLSTAFETRRALTAIHAIAVPSPGFHAFPVEV